MSAIENRVQDGGLGNPPPGLRLLWLVAEMRQVGKRESQLLAALKCAMFEWAAHHGMTPPPATHFSSEMHLPRLDAFILNCLHGDFEDGREVCRDAAAALLEMGWSAPGAAQ